MTSPQATLDPAEAARRIAVVTQGHLATCPRMLKAADALAGAGYRVRVVSGRYISWAEAGDAEIASREPAWQWTTVDWDRRRHRLRALRLGLRRRLAANAARLSGVARAPLGLAGAARETACTQLARALAAEPCDLVYGGGGALATTALAARRAGVPYALDLEDLHSGEGEGEAAGGPSDALAARVEALTLPGAAFSTAASGAIAGAYAERYGVCPLVVNNVFPLPAEPPPLVPRDDGPLRLYWFSQTIGPRRGLEEAVEAMRRAAIPGELHLRGKPLPGYLETLTAGAGDTLEIVFHPTAPPGEMVALARPYDIGLALEQPVSLNRRLCLTNKAFTYILAGLAVAATDTPGQRPLADALGEAAFSYPAGDPAALAEGLERWHRDRRSLVRARSAAWTSALERWHWEHPQERGRLLAAVAGALDRDTGCRAHP